MYQQTSTFWRSIQCYVRLLSASPRAMRAREPCPALFGLRDTRDELAVGFGRGRTQCCLDAPSGRTGWLLVLRECRLRTSTGTVGLSHFSDLVAAAINLRSLGWIRLQGALAATSESGTSRTFGMSAVWPLSGEKRTSSKHCRSNPGSSSTNVATNSSLPLATRSTGTRIDGDR